MNAFFRPIKAAASFVVLMMFTLGLVALFSSTQPATQSQPSPLATATPPVSLLFTPTIVDDDLAPTLPPSPTLPPFPTPIPTPVVTPIPTAIPPMISEVVGKAPQPFWIIYWQDNEVWRIDDQGQNRQLLLDTYQRLGRWLTGYPHPGTDCCRDSPRVVVSPDGQKLALVVLDKINLTQWEPYTYSMYVFDLQTGDLKFISEGGLPKWSPDSKHIAFIRGVAFTDEPSSGGFRWESGLWIADLETDQTYQLIEAEADPVHFGFPLISAVWSPGSQRIAYQFRHPYQSIPGIWVIDLEKKSPFLIPGTENLPDRFLSWVYVGDWLPDGQRLLATMDEPIDSYVTARNVWMLSIQNGELTQLTDNMVVAGVILSPDRRWFAVTAMSLYEREEPTDDIWLLSADGASLLRVTSLSSREGFFADSWSPDGTRLVVWRDGIGVAILSLETGEVTPLGLIPLGESNNNFTAGGPKS